MSRFNEQPTATAYGSLGPSSAPGRVFTENNRPDPFDETSRIPRTLNDVKALDTKIAAVASHITTLERYIDYVENDLSVMKSNLVALKEMM